MLKKAIKKLVKTEPEVRKLEVKEIPSEYNPDIPMNKQRHLR